MERMAWLWHAAIYGVLVLATLSALMDSPEPWWGERGLILGLSVLWAAWHGIGVRTGIICQDAKLHPLAIPYVGASAAMWLVLSQLDSAYQIFSIALYAQVFMFLPARWAVGAAAAIAGLNIWREIALEGSSVGLWVIYSTVPLAFAILLVVLFEGLARQNAMRQRLIEQLESTRGELAATERQAGILEERQRLAREIHDTLAQGFTSIVMNLEAAEANLSNDPKSAQHYLDQARRTARHSLAEARRFVWALRPIGLERASLPDALGRLAKRWSDEAGVAAETNVTGTARPLAPQSEITLLRVAQEALNNVSKHAHASRTTITLSYMDKLTVLDVQDNGIGFDPARIADDGDVHADGGFGLKAMRQRVEQVGGRLLVESKTGEGSTVVVEVPADGSAGANGVRRRQDSV